MYIPPLQPSPLHIEHSWSCCSKIYFALLLTLCTLIHFNPLHWWMHILDIITLEFALNYIVFVLFFTNHCTLASSHCLYNSCWTFWRVAANFVFQCASRLDSTTDYIDVPICVHCTGIVLWPTAFLHTSFPYHWMKWTLSTTLRIVVFSVAYMRVLWLHLLQYLPELRKAQDIELRFPPMKHINGD